MDLSRSRQVSSCNYFPLTRIFYQEERAEVLIREDVVPNKAILPLPWKERNFM